MRRIAAELALLSLGSIVVGWLIGTAQYFFANRIPFCGFSVAGGCRFGEAEFLLAFFEGGLIGAAFAFPTGLAVWYGILRRKATIHQVGTIVLGSLIGGCLLGAVISILSAFATPFLTLAIAAIVRRCTPDQSAPLTAQQITH
jgi:hypothetical protein